MLLGRHPAAGCSGRSRACSPRPQARLATFGDEARARSRRCGRPGRRRIFNPGARRRRSAFKALVFDATGIARLRASWSALHAFFHPTVDGLKRCGRVVVLGTAPERLRAPRTGNRAAGAGGLHPLARQGGRPAARTVQLVQVARRAREDAIASTLRFLLSPRSAYVSGRSVQIGAGRARSAGRLAAPACGQDRARHRAPRAGIGEAIATTLARDGAHVVGLDVPALAGELRSGRASGSAARLCDSTSPPRTRPTVLAERFADGPGCASSTTPG